MTSRIAITLMAVTAAFGGAVAQEGVGTSGSQNTNRGIVDAPYIEAVEVSEKGDFSEMRTVRTYKAEPGSVMLLTSYPIFVPWAWGTNETKSFCRPEFSVTEGEVETQDGGKDWWEESSHTNYPCVRFGMKAMVNHKVVAIRSERGIITTVETHRQPVREAATLIAASGGEGERFVSFTCGKTREAAVACGDPREARPATNEEGLTEKRWKAEPGETFSIQTFDLR